MQQNQVYSNYICKNSVALFFSMKFVILNSQKLETSGMWCCFLIRQGKVAKESAGVLVRIDKLSLTNIGMKMFIQIIRQPLN